MWNSTEAVWPCIIHSGEERIVNKGLCFSGNRICLKNKAGLTANQETLCNIVTAYSALGWQCLPGESQQPSDHCCLTKKMQTDGVTMKSGVLLLIRDRKYLLWCLPDKLLKLFPFAWRNLTFTHHPCPEQGLPGSPCRLPRGILKPSEDRGCSASLLSSSSSLSFSLQTSHPILFHPGPQRQQRAHLTWIWEHVFVHT